MAEIQQEVVLYSTSLLHKKDNATSLNAKISASSGDNLLVLLPNTISLFSMESQQCTWSISSSPNDPPFITAREFDLKVFAYSDKKISCWDTRDNSALAQENLISMECSQFGIILAFANGEILLVSLQDLHELKKLKVSGEVVHASIVGSEKDTLVVMTKGEFPTIKSFEIFDSGFKLKNEKTLRQDLSKSKIVKLEQTSQQPVIITTDRKLIIGKYEPLEICLEKYVDLPGKKYTPGIDVCQLPSGMFAVVSQKGAVNYLTVWDCQYGTLQLEKQLQLLSSAEESKDYTSRSYSICQTESESHGHVLGIGACTRPSHSKTVTLQFSLVPYYTPEMSLLTAMGRLSTQEPSFNSDNFSGQLSSIIPVAPPSDGIKTNPLKVWKSRIVEWHNLDESFLNQITDPKQSWTVGTFQEKFQEWIMKKHESLRKWNVEKKPKVRPSKANPVLTLSNFPKTEFSSRAMNILIGKCFESPENFWPSNVIEYLMRCGGVSRTMVPNGLVEILITKSEISLLELCFKTVIDMDEADYVTILKFVATTDENSPVPDLFKHWWNEKMKKKALAEAEADSNPHALARKVETIMEQGFVQQTDSKFGVSLNEGQKQFMHYCFSASRVASIFIRELGALTVAQLHTILEWLRGIISADYDTSLENNSPNQKFPLWWLWHDLPTELKYKEYLDAEYEKWLTAVDAFGLIIDSNLSIIRLSSELQLVCAEIGSAVKRDSQLLALYERKLRGPLLATVCETTINNHSRSRNPTRGQGYGKNWNNLVRQMEIGVGEYAVEEFEI